MRYPRIKDIENRIDKNGQRLCRNCDAPVPPRRKSYCSDACMKEFLRNHYWYFIRKDVLKRDHYRCSICNVRFSTRDLDIDHIIPVQMGGQLFDKANLRTLCKECHRAKSNLDKDALST